MAVTVSSTPAAAGSATPKAPRISTAAAGPILGPIGHRDQQAIASKTETFTPIVCSISQLRAPWAQTANIVNAITRPRPLLRTTARRAHSPVRWRLETRRRPATAPAMTATVLTGTHRGAPSGAISVKEKIAAAQLRR